MKPKNYFILFEPISPILEETLSMLGRQAGQNPLEVVRTQSAAECLQLAQHHAPAIVALSIPTNNHIPEALALLKSLNQSSRAREIKTVATTPLKNDKLLGAMEQMKVSVFVTEPIAARTMMFKLILQTKALDVLRRENQRRQEQNQAITINGQNQKKKEPEQTMRFSGKAKPKAVEKFVLNNDAAEAKPDIAVRPEEEIWTPEKSAPKAARPQPISRKRIESDPASPTNKLDGSSAQVQAKAREREAEKQKAGESKQAEEEKRQAAQPKKKYPLPGEPAFRPMPDPETKRASQPKTATLRKLEPVSASEQDKKPSSSAATRKEEAVKPIPKNGGETASAAEKAKTSPGGEAPEAEAVRQKPSEENANRQDASGGAPRKAAPEAEAPPRPLEPIEKAASPELASGPRTETAPALRERERASPRGSRETPTEPHTEKRNSTVSSAETKSSTELEKAKSREPSPQAPPREEKASPASAKKEDSRNEESISAKTEAAARAKAEAEKEASSRRERHRVARAAGKTKAGENEPEEAAHERVEKLSKRPNEIGDDPAAGKRAEEKKAAEREAELKSAAIQKIAAEEAKAPEGKKARAPEAERERDPGKRSGKEQKNNAPASFDPGPEGEPLSHYSDSFDWDAPTPNAPRHRDGDSTEEEVKWQAKNSRKGAHAGNDEGEALEILVPKRDISSLPGNWRRWQEGYVFIPTQWEDGGLDRLESAFPLWLYAGDRRPEGSETDWKFQQRGPHLLAAQEGTPAPLLARLRQLLRPGEEEPATNAADVTVEGSSAGLLSETTGAAEAAPLMAEIPAPKLGKEQDAARETPKKKSLIDRFRSLLPQAKSKKSSDGTRLAESERETKQKSVGLEVHESRNPALPGKALEHADAATAKKNTPARSAPAPLEPLATGAVGRESAASHKPLEGIASPSENGPEHVRNEIEPKRNEIERPLAAPFQLVRSEEHPSGGEAVPSSERPADFPSSSLRSAIRPVAVASGLSRAEIIAQNLGRGPERPAPRRTRAEEIATQLAQPESTPFTGTGKNKAA